MITPSGVTSAVYWSAIKAGNPQHIRITFLGQGIVLDDSDVDITNGATLTDIINGDTDLVFGKAVSKQLQVSIINSAKISNLQWTGEFTLEMGVEINGTTEWVQVGIFSGEKPNNVTSVQIIAFTAYDRMMLFDQLADKFAASITYPVTLATIYSNLCAYVGVQKISGNELPNIMNRTFSTAPAEITGYTCRDILSWIAEACGCYATIDETGKVRMVWFTDNTAHAITGDEEFSVESVDVNDGMTWDEADQLTWDQIDQMTWNDVCGYKETYMIDRILVKQLDNDLDINYPENITDGNTYMIVDNPFLSVSSASDVTNYIAPLYDRMVNFGGYLPVELSCVGDWCVEAGDMVTIDVGTFTVGVPIFSKTMHWNGSAVDSYETTGQKTRNVYTTDANKQKVLNSKEIRLMVDGHYYNIRNGIVINEYGVEISAGRFLKMLSGTDIRIESGADINVKNGGELNIKSGGGINVESGGGINVESGGDVNVKSGGDLNVQSGGKIEVASGGNLKVKSGGQIDINASGNLKLEGSTVEIKSGSTFEVDSQNLYVDSSLGNVATRSTLFNNALILIGYETAKHLGEKFIINLTPASTLRTINGVQRTAYNCYLSIHDEYTDPSYKRNSVFRMGVLRERTFFDVTDLFSHIEVDGTKIDKYSSNYELDYPILDIQNLDCEYAQITNLRGTYIRYATLTQNSSRNIKHDIQPMESKGEQIDKLQPVTFVYDDDPDENKRAGLIYEDTVDVMPEICTKDESSKAINYVELIPMLLKEIQDLRKRVKELEER